MQQKNRNIFTDLSKHQKAGLIMPILSFDYKFASFLLAFTKQSTIHKKTRHHTKKYIDKNIRNAMH